ncbi:hypothetical protein PQR75_06825 [Paraburkholderia fungorum]|uniref:hypothetical protein n=1 Tax=Paraburkholderia fungorum TaxID=134537 RepID=UPI0038BB3354
MSNAINTVGGSMPFDMGNLPDAAQNGIQTDASFSSVRMFSPDDTGDAGNMSPATMSHAQHAAANDGDFGTQGAGTQGAAGGGGGGGADMAGAMSQIMDLIKTAISAAMPLLGMVTSMMGKAGAAGGGAA